MGKQTMQLGKSELETLLQDALIRAGSVSALAKNINCCRQSVSNWLDGISKPHRVSIAKVKQFINKD